MHDCSLFYTIIHSCYTYLEAVSNYDENCEMNCSSQIFMNSCLCHRLTSMLHTSSKNSWAIAASRFLCCCAVHTQRTACTGSARFLVNDSLIYSATAQCSSYYITKRHGSKAKMVLSLHIPLILLLFYPF